MTAPLISGATCFFRDPAAFAVFGRLALPRLLAGRSAGAVIRVWVPGCSTGEEAYSLAIMLLEAMAAAGVDLKLEILATEIDPLALEQARAGSYPASHLAPDVSPERLARFFVRSAAGVYRVRKRVRDQVAFSRHDVLNDPPFSDIDLISCRNLLVYLAAARRRTLLARFHAGLTPGGILFLGPAETPGTAKDRFSVLDRPARIYQRLG
jgi:two-component system CheB/CheR fusion protein